MNSIPRLLIALAFLATTTLAYDSPKFDVDYLDPDLLLLDNTEVDVLVNLLVKLSVNFPDDPKIDSDLQEKAMAIALKLAPLHKHARDAHSELSKNQVPAPLAPNNSSIAEIADQLWIQTEPFSDPNRAGPEAAKLANYIREIALISHPDPAQSRVATFKEAIKSKPLRWNKFVTLQMTNASTARSKHLINPSLVVGVKPRQPSALSKTIPQRTTSSDVTFFGTTSSPSKPSSPVDVFSKVPTTPASPSIPTPSKPITPVNYDTVKKAESSLNFVGLVKFRNTKVTYGSTKLSITDTPSESSFNLNCNVSKVRTTFDDGPLSLVKKEYPNWPPQKSASFIFENQYDFRINGEADLNLPAMVLLQSAFSGRSINQKIVFTEYWNGQKYAQANVMKLLLGAKREGVEQDFLVMPNDNYGLILNGLVKAQNLKPLFSPAIISFSSWSQLKEIAFEPSERRVAAQKEFAAIEAATAKMTLVELAKNEVVQKRLQKIVAIYPQHMSARIMLDAGPKLDASATANLADSTKANMNRIDKIAKPSFDVVAKILKYSSSSVRYEGEVKDNAEDAKRTLIKIHSDIKGEARDYLFQYKKVFEAMEQYLNMNNRYTPTGKTRLKDLRNSVGKLNEIRDSVGLERFPGLD